MPITAQCDSCSAQFKVKDELLGKRVKCPKCEQPFVIKGPVAAPVRQTATTTSTKPVTSDDDYRLAPPVNPMLSLLDEAGVEARPKGRTCEYCGAAMTPIAVICVECGFNTQTGKQLETTVYRSPGEIDAGLSDGQKRLAQAEREIEAAPISAADQDFGDGADSFLIAVVALVGALILAGIGVGTIFLMDKIGENINTPMISFYGAIAIFAFCAIWITMVAFKAKPVHGLACLLTAGVYCIIFGFMQGRALLMPTLICVFAILIGLISYLIAANSTAMLWEATPFITIV